MNILLTHFTLIQYIWIGIALITFVYLFKTTAPYGRHTQTNWGPLIDNKLGWFIMEFTVLVVLGSWLFFFKPSLSIASLCMLGLFGFHYLNRSVIFPLRIQTKGKKMPVVIMGSAIFFNLMNGTLLGVWFGYFAHYPDSWLSDPRFILGVLLFVLGMSINWWADGKLINLRKPGEVGYKIPQGGLFRYVSCPNLLGEVIEWGGFALLTWSLPGFTFWIWTFANLVPRALAHHQWYVQKFAEYPTNRKAWLPFIW